MDKEPRLTTLNDDSYDEIAEMIEQHTSDPSAHFESVFRMVAQNPSPEGLYVLGVHVRKTDEGHVHTQLGLMKLDEYVDSRIQIALDSRRGQDEPNAL